MKNSISFLLFFVLMLLVAACSSDSGTSSEDPVTGTLQLGKIASNKWTYISFANNKIVGTSAFGSSSEDSLWRNRTDWDIALCGRYLRTNSGTSGIGKGGALLITNKLYADIKPVADDSLKIDSLVLE